MFFGCPVSPLVLAIRDMHVRVTAEFHRRYGLQNRPLSIDTSPKWLEIHRADHSVSVQGATPPIHPSIRSLFVDACGCSCGDSHGPSPRPSHAVLPVIIVRSRWTLPVEEVLCVAYRNPPVIARVFVTWLCVRLTSAALFDDMPPPATPE